MQIKSERPSEEIDKKDPVKEYFIKFNNYTVEDYTGKTLLQNISCTLPRNKLILVVGDTPARREEFLNAFSGYPHVENSLSFGEIKRESKNWMKSVNYYRTIREDLYSEFTVEQIFKFVGKLKEKTEPEILKVFSVLNLREVKEMKIKEIKEKNPNILNRIVIGLGLLTENEVNIWNVKGGNTEELKKIVEEIKKNKKTNVLTVEKTKEIGELADWIVFIHSGSVVFSGPYEKMEKSLKNNGLRFSSVKFCQFFNHINDKTLSDNIDNADLIILNRMSNRIRAPQQGVLVKNSLIKSQRLNLTAVKLLLKRSVQNDFYFPGYILLLEFFFYIIIFSIIILTAYLYRDSLKTVRLNDCFMTGSTELLRSIRERVNTNNSYTTIREYFNSLIVLPGTVKWASSLSICVRFYFILLSLSNGFLIRYTLSKENIRMCLFEIQSGLYGGIDFLFSGFLEIFFRNILILTVFQLLCSYFLNYNVFNDLKDISLINYSYTDYLIALLCSIFIYNLYVYLVYLLPISMDYLKYGSFKGLLVTVVVTGLENFIIAKAYRNEDWREISGRYTERISETFCIPNLESLQNQKITDKFLIPSFLSECQILNRNNSRLFWMFDRLLVENNDFRYNSSTFTKITEIISYYLYRYGPVIVFEEVLYKIGIYKGYFQVKTPLEDFNILTKFIKESTEPANTLKIFNNLHILLHYLKPHNILNSSIPLSNIGIFSIFSTIIRCSIFPVVFISISLFFTYRFIQRKIRK